MTASKGDSPEHIVFNRFFFFKLGCCISQISLEDTHIYIILCKNKIHVIGVILRILHIVLNLIKSNPL